MVKKDFKKFAAKVINLTNNLTLEGYYFSNNFSTGVVKLRLTTLAQASQNITTLHNVTKLRLAQTLLLQHEYRVSSFGQQHE